MQCPVDGTTLAMSERQGVEIDYCPQCRGVWLDRGELDKLISRNDDDDENRWRDDDRRDDDRFRDRGEHYPRRKKKNMLGELFDFG